MRGAIATAVAVVAVVAPLAAGQQPPVPIKYDTKRAALPLLEDDAHKLLAHLNNDFDGSQQAANAASEDVDVYAGASALRVTPLQRHSARIPNWNFRVVEKPARDNEFRFIRFAWKKVGGDGVMIQLHDQNRTWIVRYFAGKNLQGWQPATEVSKDVPKEWTVVTRDLFADNNKQPMVLTGIAFTAFDGQHALFDQVMLGRSVADLDAASDLAVGKGKPGDALEPKYREALWEDLQDKDRAKAGLAVRQFLATAADGVPFVAERLAKTDLSPEQVRDRAKRVTTLVSQLSGDTDFDTRLTAEEELDKLGPAAEPAVRAALTSADPEVRYRASRLIRRMKLEDGEASLAVARAGRVVRVLERANTAGAKELLKQMTDGLYGPEFLDPATAALGRMK